MNQTTTTTTTRNNNNSNMVMTQGRRSRRGRQTRLVVTNPYPVTTVPQTVVVQNGRRTARNRRRRQRQRAKRAGLLPSTSRLVKPVNYFNRYFVHTDPTMEVSVHKLIQSYFYPQQGIHRSIATGLDPSALTLYQGSFEVATTTTNNVISFRMVPRVYAGPYNAGPTVYNFIDYLVGTTIGNPVGSGTGLGGPFAGNDPSRAGRVVSATLNIIPASTVLNRGGEGKVAYTSDTGSVSWTRSDVDNLAISRSWDGVEAMTLHWCPGNNEYDMGSGLTVNAAAGASGFVFYMVVPLGVAMAWRCEWQLGIEYEANNLYRPLVERKVAQVRPDARYFINTVVQEHWTPLMISTFKNYQERLSVASSLGGHMAVQYIDHSGLGGPGFKNPVEKDIVEDWGTIQEDPDDGFASTIGRAVKRGLCSVAEGLTGEDVCEEPMRATGRLISRGVNGYMSRSGYQQMSIRDL